MNRLEAIRQREAAATEGPWVEGFTSFNTGQEPAVLTVGRVHALTNVVARTTKDRDRAFISHARTDVPLLLAVCEAAAADIARCIDCRRPSLQVTWGPDGGWCAAHQEAGSALISLLEPEP